MKVKTILWDICEGFYLTLLVLVCGLLGGAFIFAFGYALLSYLEFLLGIFPENISLTIVTFCATVGTIIFGGSLYVPSR